jgi:hypothetical protein
LLLVFFYDGLGGAGAGAGTAADAGVGIDAVLVAFGNSFHRAGAGAGAAADAVVSNYVSHNNSPRYDYIQPLLNIIIALSGKSDSFNKNTGRCRVMPGTGVSYAP